MANVLIVDDAAFMRGSLKYILEQNGHSVVGEATDGAQALKLYKQHKPDLVTLDVLMKGVDGLSGLKAIMKYDSGAKVIMVTALGQELMQKEATKLGASGYIRKPFSVDSIVGEVKRVLSNNGE
jgi:two-component system chemotaxis response regulator CheY